MEIAIIGSRNLVVNNIGDYLPKGVTEIVSGGAKGIDTCARIYAIKNNVKLTEFLPNYNEFGKRAPLIRNLEIIDYADEVIAFWDGESHGTKFVIDNCKNRNKRVKILVLKK
ncbi:MAG: hypothetical protein U0K54_01590 [Acutalibacteraceae bacterium]|nr:hypothetical protein [Acutalibacteraceae bacterium]